MIGWVDFTSESNYKIVIFLAVVYHFRISGILSIHDLKDKVLSLLLAQLLWSIFETKRKICVIVENAWNVVILVDSFPLWSEAQ